MELGMFTLEELRDMHKSARVNEIKLCETAADWCQRGLNLADSSYIAVKAMMDEMKQLGDQLWAEIQQRRETSDDALIAPGIDMVCTSCRKPAEQARGAYGATGWQHAAEADAIACPLSGSPVMVMIGIGNEKIPLALAPSGV